MKTRFDRTEVWITQGSVMNLRDMETSHLLNTLAMFINKPERTLRMLVEDIEGFKDVSVFTPWEVNPIRDSLYNATSMTRQELIDFAMRSPLAHAMQHELVRRGVNVESALYTLVPDYAKEDK